MSKNCKATTVFLPGDRVQYIPTKERGTVSSTSDRFVFVRFDQHVASHGWDGTTAAGCRPEDLLLEVRS